MPLPALSINTERGKHVSRAPCLAACVELCNVRPAGLPVATNGLSCTSVYCIFCIIPSPYPSGTKKRQGLKCSRAKHASRTRGFALRLELSLAMSDLRAIQLPRTGYPARSFYCTFCIISIPSSHLPAQKSAGASNAGVPNMRIAACLAA